MVRQAHHVYLRLVVTITVAVALLILIIQNNGREATVWVWKDFSVPTLWLIVISGLSAVCLYWLRNRVRAVLADVHRIRAERRQLAEQAEQRAAAEQLAQQERRIDEKLRKSLKNE